jgi:hypothetical protein
MRSPHCYGPADDRLGPPRPARPLGRDPGRAHRAGRAVHTDPLGPPCCGQPAARLLRRRSGGTRPSARRHGDRSGEPGHRRRISRRRRPFRHVAVEPRHQSERRAGGRRLRLRRLLHQRLQPDAPQRDRLPVVSGRPDPARRGRRDLARHDRGPLLAPRGARRAGPLSSGAGWSRAGTHPGLVGRDDSIRYLELHLPGRHRVQRALQGGGRQQPGHGLQRSRRGPRRGGGSGVERAVLWNRDQLHPAFRGALRPALLVGRDLGRRRRSRGPRAVPM